MSRFNSVDKKKVLTLQKEKLLEELKYYERRIAEAKLNQINKIEYEESSDSDTELPLQLNIEPSITNLKIEHSSLQTCFQATQELTGLQVVQSEVNILVEDPKFDEEPVTEEGIWREVTVEGRVDLVPFCMTFFVHKPNTRFGALSYRGLRVVQLKKPHEAELNKSILPELRRPSDAFEVLKAYSSAHRSRRCTLAALAAKHSSYLRMAPLPEGGYQLKCGNLLEISWTLQNTCSQVAPFRHRLKFDLEYMDEAHVQTIMQAHKALSDPALDTDTRTALLTKIINVCLEVEGVNPLDSTASESESAPSRIDQPTKRKREDSEAMAPPKAPPKKSRPKGKENKVDNRLSGKPEKRHGDIARESTDKTGGTGATVKNTDTGTVSAKSGTADDKVKDGTKSKNNAEHVKKVSNSNIEDGSNSVALLKNVDSKHVYTDKNKSKNNAEHVKKVSNSNIKDNSNGVTLLKNINNKHVDTDKNRVEKSSFNKEANKKPKDSKSAAGKKSALSSQNSKNHHDVVVKKNTGQTDPLDVQNPPITVEDDQSKKKQTENKSKQKPIMNSDAETIKKSNKIETNTSNVDGQRILTSQKADKKTDKATQNTSKVGGYVEKATVSENMKLQSNRNILDKQKSRALTKSVKKSIDSANFKAKLLKAGKPSDKIDSVVNSALQKNTKIPQKAPASVQKIMKKNPLRISPRKGVTKLAKVPKSIRQPPTHIPRLISKPTTKS